VHYIEIAASVIMILRIVVTIIIVH